MTRTLIGIDATGTPCVKIMKGNHDPVTTPDAEIGKFYFNSKWANQVVVNEVLQQNFVQGPASGLYDYFPAGSNQNNWTFYRYRYTYENYFAYKNAHFPGLRYDMPLHEFKLKKDSNGRFIQNVVQNDIWGNANGGGQYGGYYATSGVFEYGWRNTNFFDGYGVDTDLVFNSGGYSGPDENCHKRLVVWNLPGNADPLDGPTGDPDGTSKLAIKIDQNTLKVAKPGYGINAAAPYMAFSSTIRPAKVITADDIALPASSNTVYETGIDLPEETVLDVSFYKGSTIYYPADPAQLELGAPYTIDGSKIRFFNDNGACRARFIVIADDDRPPSNGNYKVLRQFQDGGENHVQFLRPGASANPRFKDIVIDSRWPALRIIKEGYIDVGSGEHTYTRTFDSDGMFPFVKYMTVHNNRVRQPFVKWLRIENECAGDSTYATYDSDSVTFHTFVGRPIRTYYADEGSNDETINYSNNPIIGIRYYVFGIPK